jgi:hypothetical protein
MAYIIGTDAKTAAIAKQMNTLVNAALKLGDFVQAEKLIDAALSTPNQPLRAEFLHLVEFQDLQGNLPCAC